MATLSAKIFKHHKICITQKKERTFLDTAHFITEKQLTRDLKIKDPFILSAVNRTLHTYRKMVSDLDET